MTQAHFLSGVQQVWSQSFPSPRLVASPRLKNLVCPTIYQAGGRIIGLIPFPKVLVLCEMQSVSSRIWTRVAVSNSYDDNHYTTGWSPEDLPEAMNGREKWRVRVRDIRATSTTWWWWWWGLVLSIDKIDSEKSTRQFRISKILSPRYTYQNTIVNIHWPRYTGLNTIV